MPHQPQQQSNTNENSNDFQQQQQQQDQLDTALYNACHNLHFDEIKSLLEQNANINKINPISRHSPFHLLLQSPSMESLQILSYILTNHRDKVNIECRCRGDPDGDITPLFIAAKNTTVDHVKLLLQHGADIIFGYKFGYNILHYATKAPQPIEMCTFLLENDSDQFSNQLNINQANKYVQTSLAFACMQLNLPLVKLFLQHGANVDMTDGSILRHLSTHQSPLNIDHAHFADDAAESWFAKTMTQYPSYDRYYNDYYVKLDPTPIIDYLIEEYPHLNVDCPRLDGQTPFHIASSYGNLFAMAAFIKHGA
jgi:ankyrin repeat protein